MRVATWNVRHGRPRRRFTSNRKLLRTVRLLAADVLAVQEVERHVIRSWCVDQPADIAHAADAAAWRYEPVRRLALTGSDGIALCVRGELEAVRVVDLPRPADAQPRAAIVASVLVADERFTVVTTHLHDEAAVARQQLDALVTAIGASDGPLVLLGDLNLRPGDVTRPLGEAGLRVLDAPDTSPAWDPVQRIDHIAVDGFVANRVWVPQVPVSDHRPVVADLDSVTPVRVPRPAP